LDPHPFHADPDPDPGIEIYSYPVPELRLDFSPQNFLFCEKKVKTLDPDQNADPDPDAGPITKGKSNEDSGPKPYLHFSFHHLSLID